MELGASLNIIEITFSNEEERDKTFNEINKKLVRENIEKLMCLLTSKFRPTVRVIEDNIRDVLTSMGFTEVLTPTLISRSKITRMNIREDSPLWHQIFWVNHNVCLRPMLAPGLYTLLYKLRKLIDTVRIYEIGKCFRKDTRDAIHSEEFTMCNVVELSPHLKGKEEDRLKQIIESIMSKMGLRYELIKESSHIYGETLDVVVNEIEVASAVIGPVDIDKNWGIYDPWVGVGFGVERLAMVLTNANSIAKMGASTFYLDGVKLDLVPNSYSGWFERFPIY